jgi:hypothetical protein
MLHHTMLPSIHGSLQDASGIVAAHACCSACIPHVHTPQPPAPPLPPPHRPKKPQGPIHPGSTPEDDSAGGDVAARFLAYNQMGAVVSKQTAEGHYVEVNLVECWWWWCVCVGGVVGEG